MMKPLAKKQSNGGKISIKTKRLNKTETGLFVVRDEDDWAISPWFEKFGKERVVRAKRSFTREFVKITQKAFLEVLHPDTSRKVEVRFYHLNEQKKYVAKLKKSGNLLNLDICTNDGLGINFSREFRLSDGQLVARGLVERPGFPDMRNQLCSIPPGDYTLVDDDIATGITVKKIVKMLKKSVRIKKVKTLIDYSASEYYKKYPNVPRRKTIRVVDLHNFIIGSRDSGLVVRLPNNVLGRAPYIEPYASNVSRASSEKLFSYRLWEMNKAFFSALGKVYISDLDSHTQGLFLYAGFKRNTLMVDLCEYHLRFLRNTLIT